MNTFKIHRWDAIIPNEVGINPLVSNPLPMIYIKPTSELLNFASNNDYKLLVRIKETNSIYDDHVMNAIFDSSVYVPNYKPRFFAKSNFYTMMLDSYFYEYPIKNGAVEIIGLTPSKSKQQALKEDLHYSQISITVVGIILLILVFYILSIFIKG